MMDWVNLGKEYLFHKNAEKISERLKILFNSSLKIIDSENIQDAIRSNNIIESNGLNYAVILDYDFNKLLNQIGESDLITILKDHTNLYQGFIL